MTWRLARSLEKLRQQVNVQWPKRSKSSDGTIGDAAHSATASDHNPDAHGVVRALDITHDPANGVDAGAIAEALRVSQDPRIKYIISNGRIVAGAAGPTPWRWRKYTGKNPHNKHCHISVVASGAGDSVEPWALPVVKPKIAKASVMPVMAEQGDPETSVVSVDGAGTTTTEEIKDSADRDVETRGSWLSRKWKGVTGWFGGGSAVGLLGYMTDPWVIVAILGGVAVIVTIFICFMGPKDVRAWIRKQVS